MKKTIQLLSICATLMMLALPAFANNFQLRPESVPQDQCSVENKTAWYGDFLATYKTDHQEKAYDDAKKYLACPADSTDTDEAGRTAFLKKFVGLYEKQNRKDQLYNLVYVKKDYAAAFDVGRQILANDDPNYLKAYIDLGYAGTVGNPSLANDGINYAKKAIEMIESGKSPDDWKPWSGRDDVLAALNYGMAGLKVKNTPDEAIPYYLKLATYNKTKTSPFTYASLAEAYELIYAKQQADYKAKYEGKDETPESKLAQANVDQIVDRIMDADARAVALADADEKAKPIKKDWLDRLTQLYKYRHKSDAGLNEMIAGILSKPLPPQPTPLMSLPSAPGTSTPASGPGAAPAGSRGGAAATPGQPNKTTTPATTTKTAGPIKPKTRRAH